MFLLYVFRTNFWNFSIVINHDPYNYKLLLLCGVDSLNQIEIQ